MIHLDRRKSSEVTDTAKPPDPLARALRRMFQLTRRLATTAPGPEVQRLIVTAAVAAARASKGSLALFVPAEGYLRVCATVGYPDVLVENVRIPPGEGIIGRVFATRKPLVVSDMRTHPELHAPRPTYYTPSFMVVPVLGGDVPLGVLCLSDRLDGQPFDSDDLRSVRCLAATAAVALRADQLAADAGVLQHWATIDPLTGLFNRRFFERRLEEEVERARRHGLPLSLLLLDLDHFKRINDTHGHGGGDAALRVVGASLRQTVRAFDLCCRYGGDEFALLLTDSDASSALASAERVREAVEHHRPAVVAGRPTPPLTVSIGLATRGRGESATELVTRADRALYEAKAAGRNCVRIEKVAEPMRPQVTDAPRHERYQ